MSTIVLNNTNNWYFPPSQYQLLPSYLHSIALSFKTMSPIFYSNTTLPLVLHFITTLTQVLDWGFWYGLELLQATMFEQDIGRDCDLLTFNLQWNIFWPCKRTKK
jgi:hypothetical protein